MRFKTKTFAKTKKGKITCSVDTTIFVGDYYYTLYDSQGEFIKRIGNRSLNELNEAIKSLR